MSGNTLKFNNIKLNKKEFHKSKWPIDLGSVTVDQIVVPDKFKHSDEGFKHFIGYKEGEIVKPLCIIIPQMSGYIKYFENGGKNMSFFFFPLLYLLVAQASNFLIYPYPRNTVS